MRSLTLASVTLVSLLAVACGVRESADQPERQADASAPKRVAPELPAIAGPPDLALRKAALEGNVALLQAALTKGADVDAASVDGVTALMLAASKGHTEVAEVLLSKGARVDAATTREKVTALMMAANWAHTPMVDLLLGGADGSTPATPGVTGRRSNLLRSLRNEARRARVRRQL